MSTPYELYGRVNQKTRTREALLDATRELFSEGITPTVEQVADRARLSRTTAYRYFPSQALLFAAAYPEIERRSLLEEDAPLDPISRLESVLEVYTGQIARHEPELRAQLRLSLEPHASDRYDVFLRKGRAIGWIEDALSPLRTQLSDEAVHRLALAIRAVCGIEALVFLTDVAGLSREEAITLMRESAHRLLRAAMN